MGQFSGGVFAESFIKKIRSINENNRFFDGIVPDRILSVEALCIVEEKKIKFLDDHILIYNSNGCNTVTYDKRKTLDDVANLFIHSREGKNYYDSMIFPGIAVTHNALASDFMRMVEYVKTGGWYKRKEMYEIPKGRLLAILEKRLRLFEFDHEEYQKEFRLIEQYKTELSRNEYAQYVEKWNQMNRGRLISPVYKREYEFPMKEFNL